MFNRQKNSRVVDGFTVSKAQTITADVEGRDGATPLVVDFGSNIKGDFYYLWGNVESAAYTDETYDVIVQTNPAANFSGATSVEKVYRLPVSAPITATDKLQIPGLGFAPENRYGRVYFDVAGTAPNLVTKRFWVTPAFT